jgi:rsbT co-antagonist protein RsbR
MMSKNPETADVLSDEVATLRQRIVELEQELDGARAMQARAEEERQWMEDLLEQSNIPICLWHGPDQRYVYANTSYLLGSGKLDAVGKPIREVFSDSEEEIPGLLPVMDRAYTTGEPQVVPNALVRIENRETGEMDDRWFNLLYNPVRNKQNEVIGLSHFVVEVTEQMRTQQKLEKKQADVERLNTELEAQVRELNKQAQVLDQVRGSVIVADMDGHIVSWNRGSTLIYGYTAEEAIGQHISLIYPPEDHDKILNECILPLQQQGSQETELTAWNKEGQRFPSQISLSLLRDNGGEPVGMIGYSSDISERKQQEEDLRVFKTTVENAPDGISFVSPDGIITYGNPAMRELLGYGDDYIGLPVPAVFGGDTETPMQVIQEVIERGFCSGLQTYYRKDGSTLPVHVSVFAIRDEQGHIVSFPGFVRDMTEVQQAEAERTALQEQVIDAQRAALRELSAPLLPISDSVVILPLIGSIDTQRAQQVMETLLEGVADHHADTAIVDITGVAVVDTQVANALIQAAQAVRLLGAQVVLTGIGPAMAQTLVSLGADLSSIVTRGTLQNGIAYALKP